MVDSNEMQHDTQYTIHNEVNVHGHNIQTNRRFEFRIAKRELIEQRSPNTK